MPKKRSLEQEQEVLGQIYDFLFKEAKKKPEKRKPIKLSGIDGTNELASAISAALEKPGAFLTNQAAKDIQDALDITLTKILPNQSDPTAPVKVSVSNLVNILKDPVGTFDFMAKRAEANRKSGKANYLGKVMRQFTTNAWARKYADLDTQISVRLGMSAQDISNRRKRDIQFKNRYDTSAAIGMTTTGKDELLTHELANMQERAGTLIGRYSFSEERWNSFSEEEQARFKGIFSMAKGLNVNSGMDLNYAAGRLEEELKLKFNRRLSSAEQASIVEQYKAFVKGNAASGSTSVSNPSFYKNLENTNFNRRIALLRSNPNLSAADLEQIKTLEKAQIVVKGLDLSNRNLFDARNYLNSEMSSIKSLLDSETDSDRKRELRNKYRELKRDSRQLNTVKFWTSVGEVEGKWTSFQNLIVEGNLVGNILNGDFFDKDKNDLFRPSTTIKVNGVGIFVPISGKEDKEGYFKENDILNKYNTALTGLYYLTPRAIMRTLFFNGEGFAYLTYLRTRELDKYVRNLGAMSFSKEFLRDESSLYGGIGESCLSDFLSGKGADAIKKILEGSKLDPTSEAYKQLKVRLESILGAKGSLSSLQKTFNIFSWGARTKDKFTKAIEKWMSKRRQKLFDTLSHSRLYEKLFKGAAGKYLAAWVEKGGLQNIARALVEAAINALGITVTGGLGEIVVAAIAAVVADALVAVAKVLFGVIVFALIGVVGLIVMMTSSQYKQNKQTYAYANTIPGDVVYNPNYIDEQYIISGGDEPGAPGTIYTGDIEEIYNQVAAEMGLSTNLHLVTCTDGDDGTDEGPCNMIDWAWCYSGVEVYCKADKLALASDAGLTNLFRHELMHQIQVGGFGGDKPNEGALGREWGADFVSNNGGGYRFRTSDGSTMRATETAGYLVGSGVCTYAQLEELAVAPGSSGACGDLLRSYVRGFAPR